MYGIDGYHRRGGGVASKHVAGDGDEQQLAHGSHVQRDGPHGVVGRSSAMHSVYAQIERVARGRASVLIVGETGTGKELLRRDRNAAAPFVARQRTRAVQRAGTRVHGLRRDLFGCQLIGVHSPVAEGV